MPSDEPGKPTGRRWRGVAMGAGMAVILVVTALSSALLFREDLAQVVLQDRLSALGLENARFRVENFTTDSIAIAEFSTGTAMSFDRLAVGYSASELLKGRVSRIILTGLQVDLTEPGPWAGLRSQFGGKGDSGAGTSIDPSVLPVIDIQQARLRIAGPGGPMGITATANLRPDPDGKLILQAKASMIGPPGNAQLGYEGKIRVGDDGGATAVGQLSATSVSLTVGKAVLKSLKIELPLSVALTAEGATVIVSESARFETNRLDLESGLNTGPINGSLTGRLTSNLSSGEWVDASVDIAVESRKIRLGDLAAKRFTTAFTTRIKAGPGTATLDIARTGRIVLDGVRTSRNGPVTKLSALLSGKVGLSWQVESAATNNSASAGLAIDHNLTIVTTPITLPGPRGTHAILGKIETSGLLAANGAYQGRVMMDTGQFTLGDQSVAITGLSTRLSAKADLTEPSARLSIGTIRDMSVATISGAPVSGTYGLAAIVQHTGGSLKFQANIGGLGVKKLIAIAGSHDLAKRAGGANVSLPPVALGSDGVQPGSVIPALSTIRNVAGSISGKARLIWRNQRVNGRGRLRLEGVGGENDEGTVEGISGTIIIDSLVPPSTAPGQLLRIKKIDAGVVLTDTSIVFGLLPSGVLRIVRAEATLAGGKIILAAPAIDPVAQTATATVKVQDVQLEQLLNLVDLGDLHASGRIHGTIPIRITDGKVAIVAGALASPGGGALRFKSERAKQILKSGGDQVGLMLQALENFSYERLGVDINKSLSGNTRVTLRTLGHNPAVLRGRKFQINVNLETNLDRLLGAALEWYRLSGRALRAIVPRRTRKGTR